MIRSFKHRGLDRFFTHSDKRGIPSRYAARLERVLDRLDAAIYPEDMNLPGYCFHELKRNHKGCYAVGVSGNSRLTFRFNGQAAIDVNLEDDH